MNLLKAIILELLEERCEVVASHPSAEEPTGTSYIDCEKVQCPQCGMVNFTLQDKRDTTNTIEAYCLECGARWTI